MGSPMNNVFLSLVTFTILLDSLVQGDLKVLNFTQKLDHSGLNDEMSNLTFQQRLLVDDSQWGGAGAPIFVLFGGENGQTFSPKEYGILGLSATEFKAMLVNIQHRFYGDSVPLGSIDLAMADERVRKFLATDQTLEDYLVIIQSLKANYSANNSPVIVVGMGYAGALAIWFRLKYPQITIGALASSTPLMYYGNSTPGDGYCSIVSKDFQDYDSQCYESIRKSKKLYDDIASQPDGLAHLSHIFNTCRPLQSADDITYLLAQVYSFTVQYDDVDQKELNTLCHFINNEGGSIQGYVSALYEAMEAGEGCFDGTFLEVNSPFEPPSNLTTAWAWQKCTELIFPIGCTDTTMLPAKPFDMNQFTKSCQKRFGIVPQPYTPISIFKARNIEESLIGFGGNIIFSNGLRDPYCSGGILKDLSKTIVAITAEKGNYAWDLYTLDYGYDPKWLKEKREEELKIFRHWINHFHHINMGHRFSCCAFIIYFLEVIILYLCT
ncbi:hypothetical protein BVRB_4g087130 [Beta vulgaris subsp. vulgaris]|uniref:Serine carboxypeptidase S28 family protein n=1 Tax=Beta vulgaris subsp. vulgaris TaxID=3555 RepID=A0A0J8CM33_BETVV|nr:hypothetical protein BVRB_4g087130 [Beta vulgaris subsp. vulgaris]